MNVELLRKIAAVIQEKPAEFDMGDFRTLKPCGTAYCIGGWAHILSGGDPELASEKTGRKALGISGDEAERLFFVTDEDSGGWPEEFRGESNAWEPTPQQAAARIERFIETGGRE
jgi:hypothetical protein